MAQLLSGTASFGSLRQVSRSQESMSHPRPSCSSSTAKVAAPSRYLPVQSGCRTLNPERSGASTLSGFSSLFRNRRCEVQKRFFVAGCLLLAGVMQGQQSDKKQSDKKGPKDPPRPGVSTPGVKGQLSNIK